MGANERQVGGNHYKFGYEHWDWVLILNLTYLEGNTTKYVTRHRKKDGLKDLQKALHYLDKIMEWGMFRGYVRSGGLTDLTIVRRETRNFASANTLTDQELEFCDLIALWRTRDDLMQAKSIVLALIKPYEQATAVPATDSNKHADRA